MRKIHLSKFPERPQVLKASLMFVEDNRYVMDVTKE